MTSAATGDLMRAGHMLSWPAERYPDKVAITYQGQNLTFRDVDTRVNRLAKAEHAYILNHSDSRLLLLDADYLPTWEQMKAECPDVRHVILATTEPPAGVLSYEQVYAVWKPGVNTAGHGGDARRFLM